MKNHNRLRIIRFGYLINLTKNVRCHFVKNDLRLLLYLCTYSRKLVEVIDEIKEENLITHLYVRQVLSLANRNN